MGGGIRGRRRMGWAMLLGLALVACSRAGVGDERLGFSPFVPGAGVDDPTPSPSPSASASPIPKIPFATLGGRNSLLALYDPNTFETLLFPGAGRPVFRVSEPYPGVFLFDDLRSIYLYGERSEVRTTVVDGAEVGGFAFDAATTRLQSLFFRGTADPAEAALGIGDVYVVAGKPAPSGFHLGPWLGKPASLTLVNALGRQHGGVRSFRSSVSERFYVFTTGDGGLYLFETLTGICRSLLPDDEITNGGRALEVRIDPFQERFVVWSDRSGLTFNMIDLVDGGITRFPYADLAVAGFVAFAPRFIDRTEVLFVIVDPERPRITRFLTYDIVTNHLKILAILNLALDVLPFVPVATGDAGLAGRR